MSHPSLTTLTPRTLRHAVSFPRPTAEAYLVIEDGDEVVVLNVPEGRTSLGRSFAAGIELDDPTVSRRHAILVNEKSGVRILDDRSLNGVYVNDVRTSGHTLSDGDRIVLGRVRLRFVLAT